MATVAIALSRKGRGAIMTSKARSLAFCVDRQSAARLTKIGFILIDAPSNELNREGRRINDFI